MRMYQLEIPTKIYFGRGIAFQALAEEKVFLNGNVCGKTKKRTTESSKCKIGSNL